MSCAPRPGLVPGWPGVTGDAARVQSLTDCPGGIPYVYEPALKAFAAMPDKPGPFLTGGKYPEAKDPDISRGGELRGTARILQSHWEAAPLRQLDLHVNACCKIKLH